MVLSSWKNNCYGNIGLEWIFLWTFLKTFCFHSKMVPLFVFHFKNTFFHKSSFTSILSFLRLCDAWIFISFPRNRFAHCFIDWNLFSRYSFVMREHVKDIFYMQFTPFCGARIRSDLAIGIDIWEMKKRTKCSNFRMWFLKKRVSQSIVPCLKYAFTFI